MSSVRWWVAGALLLASVAGAGGPRLQVQAEEGLEGAKARVEALAEGDYSRELELAGMEDFGAPIQVVLARDSSHLATVAPRWASAFTVADRSLIVLFPRRTPAYPDHDLKSTLRHELMHILVYRATRGRRVPRWFNEGLATVAGREWGFEDRARHALGLIRRGPRTAAELERAFAGDSPSAARAYALSAALMRSLMRRHGDDTPPRILDLVATGVPFRKAFRRVTGSTADAEIERFFGSEALWFTWVPFLTSGGVLWGGITVLALVAIRRRRRRNAEMHAKWEREEQLEAERLLKRVDPGDRWSVN